VIASARRRFARRDLAGFAALLAGLVIAGVPAGASSQEAAAQRGSGPPNVVVVMTDDQNVGRDVQVMKRTQRDLADRGVSFENFFATFPLCCPSRTTYLTGQYAHNHGVVGNIPRDGGGFPAFDDSKTTAVALHDAGYEVAQIGKFLNGYAKVAQEDPSVIPAGYDRWFVPLGKTMYDWSVDDQGQIREFDGPQNYQTNVYARKAVDYMDQQFRSDQPFWLTVATHAPHGEPHVRGPNPRPAPRDGGRFAGVPLPRTPSFNERDVSDKPAFLQVPRLTLEEIDKLQRRYDDRLASLLAVDRLVARLVDEVRQRHALRNTWFIFTSDNGFLFGQHRLTRKNVLYDESTRVPLMIRGPRDDFPHGVVRTQVTGNIDLSPTILDIANVPAMLTLDGHSLLRFGAHRRFQRDRDILLENAKSEAVRSRHWMYAEHDSDGDNHPDAFELYNMKSDPYQLDNRYEDSLDPASHPRLAATRAQLEERLDQLRDCAGHGPPDPCD
jgi:N-acetylglucosamine-6-sulfatase